MKEIVAWIFGLALMGNAALFVPQALAVWRKKSDEGISLITFGGFNLLQAIAIVQGIYQHDIALIAGEHSVQALEALLIRILPFLKTSAAVAMWIGPGDRLDGGKLQSLLERMGFRVEVGSRCESGFVLSARRRECGHLANAA